MKLEEVYVKPRCAYYTDVCLNCGEKVMEDGEWRCYFKPSCQKWRMLSKMQHPRFLGRGRQINLSALEEKE